MPFTLTQAIDKEFHLIETDVAYKIPKGEKTKVTIRVASSGENNTRKDLFAEFTRTFDRYNDDTVKVTSLFAVGELKRKEAFLTMSACNIVGENEEPLFVFEKGKVKDEHAFNVSWDSLPTLITDEIGSFVREFNFHWTPEGEA